MPEFPRRSCGPGFGCCARLDRLCNDENRSRRRQREPDGDWQRGVSPRANRNLAKIEFIVVRTIAGVPARRGDRVSVSPNNNCQRARGRRHGFIHAESGMHRVNTWGEKLQRRSLSTLFCICYAELGQAETVRAAENCDNLICRSRMLINETPRRKLVVAYATIICGDKSESDSFSRIIRQSLSNM